MSHLTRTGTELSATGADRLGFGVPGYAHPLVAPVEWAELTRPGTPLHWVVLNVADGPGARPDPHCLEAAGRLRNAGVRVLGHLDLRHGTRPGAELLADAARFAEWYRVAGYYLDRCPTDRTGLPAVRRTATALVEPGGTDGCHLVLGHGSHPWPGYAELPGQLVTFSGPWADYRWSQAAPWTADHPPERFAHLVHGVPRGHLEEAMRIARWQGAGTIFFTDRTAHRTPPPADGIAGPGGTGRAGRSAGIAEITGITGIAGIIRATGNSSGGRPGGGTVSSAESCPENWPESTSHNSPFEALPGYWDEIVSRIGPGISE
ncbi:spherulation-specific family 4 protein [Streptomyces pyxinae]|uniref:spherulation-specific family 4 protein n=1 Tax=Streptomyces pyxinae TaxID=2970734 RepID=UPI003D17EE93